MYLISEINTDKCSLDFIYTEMFGDIQIEIEYRHFKRRATADLWYKVSGSDTVHKRIIPIKNKESLIIKYVPRIIKHILKQM
jgi:hypothetical protein